MGSVMIRQLRVGSNPCRTRLVPRCEDNYNIFNEEKGSFDPEWKNQSGQTYTTSIRRAFQYRSDDALDTYPYSGSHATYSRGGYVYEFRGRLADLHSNISSLRDLSWIDGQTRAVFIDLSVFNPNVQLFTAVTLLVEILSTGGVHPYSRFEPVSFLGRQIVVSHPWHMSAAFV